MMTARLCPVIVSSPTVWVRALGLMLVIGLAAAYFIIRWTGFFNIEK